MHALYPHLQGRTSLAYSECGRYLFTVGENMMARRFRVGAPQDEPDTVELPFTAYDVAVSSSHFAVCGDSGSALLFSLDSNEKTGSLARTALPLRHITFSNDSQWAGIVGDDFCSVVNVEDITETRPIPVENARDLVFHPVSSDLLAVSCYDSTVRVVDLSRNKVVAELDSVVPAISDFADDRSSSVSWSPHGDCFALPTKTFEIVVYSTRDWLVATRLNSGGHENAITTLEFSPNGRYLLSGGRDSKVLVWDVAKRTVVKRYDVPEVLRARWHPHNNEISFVTGKGQLYTVCDVISDSLHPPFGGDPLDLLQTSNNPRQQEQEQEQERSLEPQEEQDNDNNNDNEEDLFVSDTEHFNDHPVHQHPPPQPKRRRAIDVPYKPHQHAFQSGSTPFLQQRRYLCMSPVGYVWTVRHSSSHNSATITFFDQSVHREVHIQDTDQFDLAALTSSACIFANSKSGKVSVRFHSALNDNWDTSLDLEVDGGVLCVALSSEVAVIFTKTGLMRTFTLYGTPLGVSSVGSTVVCAAAHDNEVVSVYHENNCYTYSFEDVALSKIFQCRAPLGITSTKVSALFFSDEGEPCVMDSAGTLMTLVRGRQPGQARWTPVLGKPSGDAELQRKYWPIGVQESKLLCVVLRGQQQYPTIPMPITDEIDLAVPGLPALEAQYLVMRTQHDQLKDRLHYITAQLEIEPDEAMQDALADSAIELDKMLLRQFQQACQDQRLNRGLQIVQLIQTPESLQAAAKVASAYELQSLASRIIEAIE